MTSDLLEEWVQKLDCMFRGKARISTPERDLRNPIDGPVGYQKSQI